MIKSFMCAKGREFRNETLNIENVEYFRFHVFLFFLPGINMLNIIS